MKFQIIYSLRVMKQLVEWGFFPVKTMPNPVDTKYNCWIFEDTDEFRQRLSTLQE